MLDVLIKNGLVFDGLGTAPIHRDIAIQDGQIVNIAPSLSMDAH